MIQKEKRRAVEKASIISEIYIYHHKQNVGRSMNVKSSVEVSGRHKEHIKAGGKNILVIKWPRTWPNCV